MGIYHEGYRYTRTLSLEEHKELVELREKERRYLEPIAKHTQTLVKMFEDSEPQLTGNEIIVIVVHGMKSFKLISDDVGFSLIRRKFHFGAPFSSSWLVSVADAVDLKNRFPEQLHYPGDADVLNHINKIVSPYSWDPANLKANPINLD